MTVRSTPSRGRASLPSGTSKAACVNLGRHVTFDLPGGGTGSGTAIDVDADGQLIVRTDSGEEKVFTGEVSVHGIYGAV